MQSDQSDLIASSERTTRAPVLLAPRVARALVCSAAAMLLPVGVSLAQVPPVAAPAMVTPAMAAPVAPPGMAVPITTPAPVSANQKLTVEELLRADAAKALGTVSVAAEVAPQPMAVPAEPVRPPPPPEDPGVVAVNAIYGTRSAETDTRVAEISVDGAAKSMSAGDIWKGYRLLGIVDTCVVVIRTKDEKAAASASRAAAARAERLARSSAAVKRVMTKGAPAPAASVSASKSKRVCIDDPLVATPIVGDNLLTLGGGTPAMPSPIFRPPAGAPPQ